MNNTVVHVSWGKYKDWMIVLYRDGKQNKYWNVHEGNWEQAWE